MELKNIYVWKTEIHKNYNSFFYVFSKQKSYIYSFINKVLKDK